MTDELPGFVSDLTAHENAVDAAIVDGWEIRGYAASPSGTDTLVLVLLWKAGAQPEGEPVDPLRYGEHYGPLREVAKAKAKYAKRM